MDISNSTGQSAVYRVVGRGGESVHQAETLSPQTVDSLVLPPGTSWKIQFLKKEDQQPIAEATVNDPFAIVSLIEGTAGKPKLVVAKYIPSSGPTYLPTEAELASYVRQRLMAAGIPFDTDKSIGGIQPDFVITSPDGRLFVLEVKRWAAHEIDLPRVARQVELYQRTTGVDRVFIVVPNAPQQSLRHGVVSLDMLVRTLKSELAKKSSITKKSRVTLHKTATTIFVAMPFDPKYDDVFFVAVAQAAKAVGAKARRVDQEAFTGDIIKKILTSIDESSVVIVDLSEGKPNVLYEAGYAHALNRPTIHICSTPLKELPFDVSHWSTLSYAPGQTHALKKSLTTRLRAVLKNLAQSPQHA